jgi:predicted  nucleic acid-binding Zn-ribbon protein
MIRKMIREELAPLYEQLAIVNANVLSKASLKDLEMLQEENDKLKGNNTLLKDKIETLKAANKTFAKQISEIQDQKRELEYKVRELQSDRYLVHKIPSGRTPVTKYPSRVTRRANAVQKELKEKGE